MKIFGYSREGFLYIDHGNSITSQQTTSDESNMMDRYASLPEFKNFDDAIWNYLQEKQMREANAMVEQYKFAKPKPEQIEKYKQAEAYWCHRQIALEEEQDREIREGNAWVELDKLARPNPSNK